MLSEWFCIVYTVQKRHNGIHRRGCRYGMILMKLYTRKQASIGTGGYICTPFSIMIAKSITTLHRRAPCSV